MLLTLAGELSIAQIANHHAALLAQLAAATAAGPAASLNLAAVTELDSAGVQLLLSLRAHLAQQGLGLQLDQASAEVRQALDTFHLDATTLAPRDKELHVIGDGRDE